MANNPPTNPAGAASKPSAPAPTNATAPTTAAAGGSELQNVLTALAGQDGQTVISAITNAVNGDQSNLNDLLDQVGKRDADIQKLIDEVNQNGIKEADIEKQLADLQQQADVLQAQRQQTDSQITLRTDSDVDQAFGIDLLNKAKKGQQ